MRRIELILLAAGACALGACSDDGRRAIDGGTDPDGGADSGADAATAAYAWHTFYGSYVNDSVVSGRSVALDGSGNIHVVGITNAYWSGSGGEEPLQAYGDGGELFVLKLGPDGDYLWHTFYEFVANLWSVSVATDASDNIYITGSSASSWSGPGGEPPLNDYSGGGDPFVLKLGPDGEYLWHTFYGSNFYATGWEGDGGQDLALDGNGHVYVTGHTDSPWTGPDGEPPIDAHSGGFIELFMLKLGTDGEYEWHTFFGIAGDMVVGTSLAVDESGNAYAAGTHNRPPFDSSSDSDLLALKLGPDGAHLWHAFYGSTGRDGGGFVTTNGSGGDILVMGGSDSSWAGPNGEAPLHAHSGGDDLFLLRLEADGAYGWHTFLSVGGGDWTGSFASDGSGCIYVAGASGSSWNGPGGEAPLHAHSGGDDIMLMKLEPDGSYDWHAFYGSEGDDSGSSLTSDGSGNVFATGSSAASWTGPDDEQPLHGHSPNSDLFVLKHSI